MTPETKAGTGKGALGSGCDGDDHRRARRRSLEAS